MSDLLPPAVRRVIYAVAIPANAFVIAMGWGGNRWVLGVLAALNAGGFSIAVANVNPPSGGEGH
jgi:hypothetical protein